MFADLASCKASELAWQPRRGSNTIGMLLAHCAVVEVYWLMIATRSFTPEQFEAVLGIGIDDDGMPLPPDGMPPSALGGRSLAYYRRLHDRARAFVRRTAHGFAPAALVRVVQRLRRDGSRHDFNVRWILYHVLEHQAAHYGQMLLLRHQYRDQRSTR